MHPAIGFALRRIVRVTVMGVVLGTVTMVWGERALAGLSDELQLNLVVLIAGALGVAWCWSTTPWCLADRGEVLITHAADTTLVLPAPAAPAPRQGEPRTPGGPDTGAPLSLAGVPAAGAPSAVGMQTPLDATAQGATESDLERLPGGAGDHPVSLTGVRAGRPGSPQLDQGTLRGGGAVTTPTAAMVGKLVFGQVNTVRYTNWKNETAERRIIPRSLYHGSNEWHPTPQYLVECFDLDKMDIRTYALGQIHEVLSSV